MCRGLVSALVGMAISRGRGVLRPYAHAVPSPVTADP